MWRSLQPARPQLGREQRRSDICLDLERVHARLLIGSTALCSWNLRSLCSLELFSWPGRCGDGPTLITNFDGTATASGQQYKDWLATHPVDYNPSSVSTTQSGQTTLSGSTTGGQTSGQSTTGSGSGSGQATSALSISCTHLSYREQMADSFFFFSSSSDLSECLSHRHVLIVGGKKRRKCFLTCGSPGWLRKRRHLRSRHVGAYVCCPVCAICILLNL